MAQESACSDRPAIMIVPTADRTMPAATRTRESIQRMRIVAGDGKGNRARYRPRDEQQAGAHGGIAHQTLGEQRQQRDGAEQASRHRR